MATTQDWQPPARDRVREHSSDSSTREIDRKTRSVLAEVGNSRQRIYGRLSSSH